jgi:uracil-DNA glycosylase
MTPQRFVSELGAVRFENAFNPYSELCHVCDSENAPGVRSQMLSDTLTAASTVELDALWVGRDLGYRGGRRTGLPFTDDVHLPNHQARWGVNVVRPTKDSLVRERAATTIWGLLEIIDCPIFMWNVFPLHPHKSGDPFTNRRHTAAEAQVGLEILHELIDLLRPKKIIAIGNDAESAVRKLSDGVEIFKVRHPSFGGQTEFVSKMRRHYGVSQGTLL